MKTVVATKEFTTNDIELCSAVSDAIRSVAVAFLRIPGVTAGNMLDGMLSAYFNEAMRLMGPESLRDSVENLLRQWPHLESLMAPSREKAH